MHRNRNVPVLNQQRLLINLINIILYIICGRTKINDYQKKKFSQKKSRRSITLKHGE
jgi:hypothetical protein